MHRIGIAAFLAVLMSFTAQGQAPAKEIRALRSQFNAAIARHDVEAVVSFLDAEYQVTTGRGDLLHGKAGEADSWKAEFARAGDLVYVRTPESVEVSASGERAAEFGSWVGTWTAPDGPQRRAGRYAAHWRAVDGTWKVRAELFVTLCSESGGCEPDPGKTEEARIVEALKTMYVAATNDDLALFRSVAAPGFYAFDAGKRFTGDTLMELIKGLHDAGSVYVWNVTEPEVRIDGDTAWITYVNRGSIQDASGKKDVTWLESAVLRKDTGRWRIHFFHSSRGQ